MSEIFHSRRVQAQAAEARRKISALLRNAIPDSMASAGRGPFLNAERFRLVRLRGFSRTWEEDRPETLCGLMRQIYAGAYRPGAEFCFLTAGDGTEFTCYWGAENTMLQRICGSASGLLEDAEMTLLEDRVRIADLRRHFLGDGSAAGGVVTGFPSIPGKEDSGWTNPSRVIAEGMQGQPFMMLFQCRAVSGPLLNRQLEQLRKEQSEALFQTELTVQGDEIRHVSETVTIRDYQQYGEDLEKTYELLQEAQTVGAWAVAATYLARDEAGAEKLGALIQAAMGAEGSGPEPVRCVRTVRPWELTDGCRCVGRRDDEHPLTLGERESGFSSLYTTELTSRQLASCCIPPDREIPGFYLNDPARFDLTGRPGITSGAIRLGDVMRSPYSLEPAGYYFFPAQDLDRHALVVGATGGGKSNTIRSLLKTLWTERKIPFLVIESAKSEYWEMANYGMDISAVQLGDYQAPFRLNPFECTEGFPLQTHVDSLLSTFRAAFEMYAPMPFLLEQAVYAVYEDYGWDVATGENGRPVRLYPCLSDLYWQIPRTVENSAYDKEIKDNVTGSLQTRVRSLMIGGKGKMMDCRHSTSLEKLLRHPTVLELENLGDDDTKAFAMGLLMSRLYEYRRVQSGGTSRPFSHLLVLEEAHRLLKRVQGSGGENGNPQAASVAFFCNMLSEIRSYGQGILIADQSPEKLAEDAVRNTNLKIVHRMVDARDRETAAGAMHMSEAQREALTMLKRGVAAVYSEGDHRPRLVRMPLMRPEGRQSRLAVLERSRGNPAFARNGDAPTGPEMCRFCPESRNGTCASPRVRQAAEAIADRPLTAPQRRYYETEIKRNGPEPELLWSMEEFAVLLELREAGRPEDQAGEMLKRADRAFRYCAARRTLERLDGLKKEFRDLFADRFANWMGQQE